MWVEPSYVIGLMSGTSCDGVDAALLLTDGETHLKSCGGMAHSYPIAFQKGLRQIMGRRQMTKEIAAIERRLTDYHIQIVQDLLKKHSLHSSQIRLIGFHGQTIAHHPREGFTWQIGDASLLATRTQIDVVHNFREQDVVKGGQGAPLVPIYHAALTASLPKPLVVVNIGGVANVTWVGHQAEDLLAFDTGPGNGLINDWCLEKTGIPLDQDGRLASKGTPALSHIQQMLRHHYFLQKPPKSLDRLSFSIQALEGLSIEDGAATLTDFTALTIARAAIFFPEPPKSWLIAGGGRHNPALMARLRQHLSGKMMAVDELGWAGDLLEAEAFAYLAARSVRRLPLSYPGTTGVPYPLSGGELVSWRRNT